MKFESMLKRNDGVLIYTGILFVVNLIYFAFFRLVYIENPLNMMTLETILSEMWLTTCFNFHTFGNLIGNIRGVS